jgi:hypothetical protein
VIVLDEQLLGRAIEDVIARWYPGIVCFVTDLCPGTVIKDEAILTLLKRILAVLSQPRVAVGSGVVCSG